MDISYSEFANFCKVLAKRFDVEFFTIDKEEWDSNQYKERVVICGVYDSVPEENIAHVAYVKYVSGGLCNGYYGSSADVDIIPDEPLSLDSFMFEIIRTFKPTLTFVDYHNEIIPLIENINFSETGYYGNCREYRSHVINLETLYNELSN